MLAAAAAAVLLAELRAGLFQAAVAMREDIGGKCLLAAASSSALLALRPPARLAYLRGLAAARVARRQRPTPRTSSTRFSRLENPLFELFA